MKIRFLLVAAGAVALGLAAQAAHGGQARGHAGGRAHGHGGARGAVIIGTPGISPRWAGHHAGAYAAHRGVVVVRGVHGHPGYRYGPRAGAVVYGGYAYPPIYYTPYPAYGYGYGYGVYASPPALIGTPAAAGTPAPGAAVEPPAVVGEVIYYCPAAGYYYPQLRSCPSGWQTLPARPSDLPGGQPRMPVR
jgi:hypothetical protein